jgi:hypothetical protein
MLEFKDKCVIGIDLAASNKNPTGWAMLKNKTVKTQLLHTDNEIIENALKKSSFTHSHRCTVKPTKKRRIL